MHANAIKTGGRVGGWADLQKFQEGLCTCFRAHGLDPLGSMSLETHNKSGLTYCACTPTRSRRMGGWADGRMGGQTSHWLWSPERAHPAGRATYCSCVSIYMTPATLHARARARARERNSWTKKIKYILNYWFCYIEFSSPMRVSLVYHARSSCCKHAESPESPQALTSSSPSNQLLMRLEIYDAAQSAQNMKLDINAAVRTGALKCSLQNQQSTHELPMHAP